MKTRILIKALILACGIGLASASSASPISYNGHLYDLTTATTWTGAEAQAVAAGGHLVTVNDAAEQSFLNVAYGTTENLWIGFTDAAAEGTFAWISGQAVTFTWWNGGEPNDAGGNEDYTLMNWGPSGLWNDCPNDGCGINRRGIIEYVPEPGSLALLSLGLFGFGALRRRLG